MALGYGGEVPKTADNILTKKNQQLMDEAEEVKQQTKI